MTLKPLTAVMNHALATDELSSYDAQWRAHMLKTAGMPKEFVELCTSYQGFCDTPCRINVNSGRRALGVVNIVNNIAAATVLAAALSQSVGSVPAPNVSTRRGVEIDQHLVHHNQ